MHVSKLSCLYLLKFSFEVLFCIVTGIFLQMNWVMCCDCVTPFAVTDMCLHSLVQVLAYCITAPSHYLNQWWTIVSRTCRNRLQWKLSYYISILIWENVYTFVWKMLAILLRVRCVNSLRPSDANMRHQPMPSLVQIMACHLAGNHPLSEPMLEYC